MKGIIIEKEGEEIKIIIINTKLYIIILFYYIVLYY